MQQNKNAFDNHIAEDNRAGLKLINRIALPVRMRNNIRLRKQHQQNIRQRIYRDGEKREHKVFPSAQAQLEHKRYDTVGAKKRKRHGKLPSKILQPRILHISCKHYPAVITQKIVRDGIAVIRGEKERAVHCDKRKIFYGG